MRLLKSKVYCNILKIVIINILIVDELLHNNNTKIYITLKIRDEQLIYMLFIIQLLSHSD